MSILNEFAVEDAINRLFDDLEVCADERHGDVAYDRLGNAIRRAEFGNISSARGWAFDVVSEGCQQRLVPCQISALLNKYGATEDAHYDLGSAG